MVAPALPANQPTQPSAALAPRARCLYPDVHTQLTTNNQSTNQPTCSVHSFRAASLDFQAGSLIQPVPPMWVDVGREGVTFTVQVYEDEEQVSCACVCVYV